MNLTLGSIRMQFLDFQRLKNPGKHPRYPYPSAIFLITLAMLSGKTSLRGIEAWFEQHQKPIEKVFGPAWKKAPSYRTIGYWMDTLTEENLMNALVPIQRLTSEMVVLQVDGKSLRGRDHDRKIEPLKGAPCLISLFEGEQEVVWAQTLVPCGKEEQGVRDLLKHIDLSHTWVTLDALHTKKKP